MNSLTLKHHNSFKNESNKKAANSFARRTLISKLHEEALQLNDIFVNWSSGITDPVTSENRSFGDVSLFSLVTFK